MKTKKEKTADDFITWLHKELVELMYENKLSSDHMTTYHKLIAKWRQNNESKNNV